MGECYCNGLCDETSFRKNNEGVGKMNPKEIFDRWASGVGVLLFVLLIIVVVFLITTFFILSLSLFTGGFYWEPENFPLNLYVYIFLAVCFFIIVPIMLGDD